MCPCFAERALMQAPIPPGLSCQRFFPDFYQMFVRLLVLAPFMSVALQAQDLPFGRFVEFPKVAKGSEGKV